MPNFQFDPNRRGADAPAGLELERLISEREASSLLGISPDTLRRKANRGEIQRIHISVRRVAYRVRDLLALTNTSGA